MEAKIGNSPSIYVVHTEVDPTCTYHCEALAGLFPDAREVDFPAGERVPIERADGVVLTGSQAGVYETDRHEWIGDLEAFVRDIADRGVPTLGVCFGHQVVNAALGGTVEHRGMTAGLVAADLDEDPLFEGVGPVVPALHGDVVTAPGEAMDVIAAADHAPVFGTCHADAPLWTVQFHPEITAGLREELTADFAWTEEPHSFADVTAERVCANFRRLVGARV